MKAAILLALGLWITPATTIDYKCTGFVPPNTLWLPATITVHAISKNSYDRVLNRIETEYTKDFKDKGATFEVIRSWSDGTVNAQAWQEGYTWKIEMFGGMARYHSMTADAFTLVACHEIGHHLGGAPKYPGSGEWASNEGQADYFATLRCAKRMIAISLAEDSEKDLADVLSKVSNEVKTQCAANAEPNEVEQITCMRVNQAATVLAGVLADLGEEPKPQISTPDKNRVSSTDHSHPAAQCRLDTMYQGSLCDATGELSDTDPEPGTCYSTNVIRGGRPFCWFHP